MNDTTEKESDGQSMRSRIGKFVMWVGVVSLIIGVLSMFAISTLVGTGAILTNPNYQILNTIAVAGIILTIIGILFQYSSTNFSKDSIWSLQTGPYVK